MEPENKNLENKNLESKTVYFSRMAFLFIIFSVVSSGYIAEILSCQMRFMFENSLVLRHVVGIIMIFVFIMLEGGWSFDTEEDEKAVTSWESGNVIHTGVMSVVIYILFLLSSKSRFWPNILFFSLLMILYLLNTQRQYWVDRENITADQNDKILKTQYVITGFAGVSLVGGFVDYVLYQMKQYKSNFSWIQFLFGGHKCFSSTK
jgi:hypothetical protein